MPLQGFVLVLLLCSFECIVVSAKADEYLDLSYSFSKETIYFPGQREFTLNKDYDGVNKSGIWYSAFSFSMGEHGGTHVDAPFHFNKEGWTVEKIPPSYLIDVPATVIDVEEDVEKFNFPDKFQVKVDHIIQHERKTMKAIPFGGVVLIHTGWSKYWPNKVPYLGWKNDTDTPTLSFPGLSEEAAKFLSDERQIVGLGIDTPSVDPGNSEKFPVHILLAKKQIFNIENVANLHLLLPKSNSSECDLRLFILPLKIIGATGSPARILGYCKRN